jgi:hypothetical protein
VEKDGVKDVSCKFCTNVFLATRNDAKRCSECRDKYLKEYRRKETTKKRRRDKNKELRKEVIAGYGNKCSCCGEHRYEFLAIDHVNGGGRKERETMSTHQIVKKIMDLNYPPEYRVLCHNCNQAIGWYGQCPHETERTA